MLVERRNKMDTLRNRVMSVSSTRKRYNMIVKELGKDIFKDKNNKGGLIRSLFPIPKFKRRSIKTIIMCSDNSFAISLKNGDCFILENR